MAEQETAVKPDLISLERARWKLTLGANVGVRPLSENIAPEVIRSLPQLGLELFYIPALELSPEKLYHQSVGSYLQELNKHYLRWRPFEVLTGKDQRDHSITRNLQEWFWQTVKDNKTVFPKLPGQWAAIEMITKPRLGEEYPESPLTEILGFSDRFNLTRNSIVQALKTEKFNILSKMSFVGNADVRLLTATEWNLVGNRKGWGKTNTCEWTNTEYRPTSGNPQALIIGNSEKGGAAFTFRAFPHQPRSDTGFRVGIFF